MLRSAPLLFAGCATLLLTACAGARQSGTAPVSEMSRAELTGLMVQSPDGGRSLGYVEDLQASPTGGTPMVLVSTGAPYYPVEVYRRVDASAFHFARDRQALVLDPDAFDAAEPLHTLPGSTATYGMPGDASATNWTGATRPR